MDKLLNEIIGISKSIEEQRALTGESFNIYKVANIEHDEVKICRFIYELINPDGVHHQGAVFLESFLNDVMKLGFPKSEIREIRIYREYCLPDSDRRIDLVIKSKHRFIPIEVKIFAKDQNRQCKDYYEYACLYDQYPCLYYLTLDGKDPSTESRCDVPMIKERNAEVSGIIAISFAEEILNWLMECEKYCYRKMLWPIYEVIRQFSSSIRELTGKSEDKEGMKIRNKIIESPENILAAATIANNFQEAKSALVNKALSALETKLDEKFCEKYGLEVTEYTKKFLYYKDVTWLPSKKQYPGIGFKCKNIELQNGKEVWLRIEVDNCLYVGFVIYDPANKNNEFEDLIELSELTKEQKNLLEAKFKGKLFSDSKEYITWEYMTLKEGNDDRINFWVLNHDAAALCDNNAFGGNIDYWVQCIGEFITRSIYVS